MARWQRYWFAPSYYLDLSVLRISAVTTQLLLWLGWLPERAGMYDRLADLRFVEQIYYEPLTIFKFMNVPLGWGILPDWDVLVTVYYLGIFAGILALFGLLTNISLLIFAVCSVYLQAFAYSFGDLHHPEAIMMIALSILALSPSGRVLSLDWVLSNRKGISATSMLKARGEFAGWPIRLLQWFFVLMYLSAVVAKLSEGGADWANGFTLQYYLIRDGLRWDSPLSIWLGQHHTLIYIAQHGVLLFQATFALAVLFPRLRWFYVPAGLALHIGILLTLRAPFYEWICLYVILSPGPGRSICYGHIGRNEVMHQSRHSELDGVGQTAVTPEAYLVYDGDCPFCSAYARYVRVRENVRLRLINARHGGDLVDEIVQAGFDLDQGMVLKIGGRFYHGADCVNVLASLSSGSNAFNRINARIFRSPVLAGALYPVLRAGRRIALALLGRSTFEPRIAARAKAAEPGRAERS